MTDIINRLRAYAECSDILGAYTESKCMYEAIEYIEQLEAENKKLVEKVLHLEYEVDLLENTGGY